MRVVKKPKRIKMVLITFHLMPKTIEHIDNLVKKGLFPSRSEFIRYAIFRLLQEYGVYYKPKKEEHLEMGL